eukprot:scaffold195679_cov29-Tisochrysis_lutea.AAC.1
MPGDGRCNSSNRLPLAAPRTARAERTAVDAPHRPPLAGTIRPTSVRASKQSTTRAITLGDLRWRRESSATWSSLGSVNRSRCATYIRGVYSSSSRSHSPQSAARDSVRAAPAPVSTLPFTSHAHHPSDFLLRNTAGRPMPSQTC